jgi:putative endopeptidase
VEGLFSAHCDRLSKFGKPVDRTEWDTTPQTYNAFYDPPNNEIVLPAAPGLHINGKATLGENIADFGGVLLGLDAFKKTEQYKRGVKIAGYTPLQRFFLGYALSWLSEERQELLRQYLLSDVHSPPKWRTNGPLCNVPEFYRAFDLRPGQTLYRPESERVHIW